MKYFNLLGKNMANIDIIDIDFTGADLSDVDFQGSNIIGDFTGAILKGAKFCCGKISKKTFDTMKIKPSCKYKFMRTVHIVEDEELLREDLKRDPNDIPKIPLPLLRTDILVLK